MAQVPNDTPNAEPQVYDELLTGGSDGVPRLYKMHRETKRVIGDDANRLREYPAMPGRVNALDFNADGSRFAFTNATSASVAATEMYASFSPVSTSVGMPDLPNDSAGPVAAIPAASSPSCSSE